MDKKKFQGSHWCAIINSKKFTYFYDPYGIPPNKSIEKFLRTSNKQLIFSSGQHQNFEIILCGYFCIYVISKFNQGNSFYDVMYSLDNFPSDQNEKFISKVF